MNAANIVARALQLYGKSLMFAVIAGAPALGVVYVLKVTHQYYMIALVIIALPLFRATAKPLT